MSPLKKFDFIIIGAGPAGLSAGRALIREGQKNILLLDKIAPWKFPVPCAEGVGKLGFNESGPINPEWIRQEISSATFHAPDGSTITYTDKNGGYIINRARMQQEIADELTTGGIVTDFSSTVVSVSRGTGTSRIVTTSDDTSYEGTVVIDASGPLTRFGKNEPICSKPADLEPAYFFWTENISIPSDRIHIYAGQAIAPGGYAWVFPRGNNAANIGIVIGKPFTRTSNIKSLLDVFLNKNFPEVTIKKKFAGAIPCGFKRPLPLAIPGLIKTGDAACTVNPISRAGISEAMLSGTLAGTAAAGMFTAKSDKTKISCAKKYEGEWNKRRGNRHQKLAKVKASLLSIPDGDYNNGARALSEIPQNEMTMSKIFRASLSRFPRLMWTMRHLM